MWIPLVLVFITILIKFWSKFRNKNHASHHRRNQNGPTMYPLIGQTLELLRNRDRVLEWHTEYLKKEPTNTLTLKRFGDKPLELTADPEVVEHILRSNFDNYPKSHFISQALGDLLGDGIFNADGDVWRVQRKLASYEFSTKSLRDFVMESLAQEVEVRLIPTIDSVCQAGAEFDLQDVFMRLAFDTICKLAFGFDPVCLGPDFPEVKFAQAFDSATSLSVHRLLYIHPLIWKALRALNVGRERRLREALRVVDEFAADIIQKRRGTLEQGGGAHQDLLSRFLSVDSFSDKFLRDIIISFVLAGKDTSSVTLTWLFWLLCRHPEVKRKIVAEVEKISPSKSCCFSYEELREMHYLHAAICESLRLYPAVPVNMKMAKETDVLPNGIRVEKGMRVGYEIYTMGRLEKIWGKDCMEFKPERWIDDDGKFVAESPYKFAAFQAGPRICLGREMAMLQIKFVAAALLPKFEFEVVRDSQRSGTPQNSINMTLQMKDGLLVRARKL